MPPTDAGDLELPRRDATVAVRSLSVFFPCYNDEATIASMVEQTAARIDQFGLDAEIIVVNDGSTDRSAEVLEALTHHEPRLRIVTHDTNRGYGGALISGFEAATREWVFYTDGDGQYRPQDLDTFLLAASDQIDVVQGYKLSRSDNLARRIIGRLYHRTVSMLFGLRVRDTDCDFRLIRHEALERVSLTKSSGTICVELVRKLQNAGARFVELGVDHHPRLHGRSQFFRFGNLVRTFRQLLELWIEVMLIPTWQRRKAWFEAIVVVPTVWTLTFLTALPRPVGRADEAWFLWVAARANGGATLYRGVYYVSTPLAMWCMQLMVWLFGTHIAVERALAATCFTASLTLVWLIARRVEMGSRGRVLLVAGVFLYGAPVAHFGSIYSLLATTCTLAATFATLHILRRDGTTFSRRAVIAAGISAGVAFATKPNIGLLALLAVVATIIVTAARSGASRRTSARMTATALAGFAAFIVAMVIPLIVNGSISQMVGDVFLGKGNAYFAIEGRTLAPGFWDAFSFLTGSTSPLGQLILRTGRLVPLVAVVLIAVTLIRARAQRFLPTDVVTCLAFAVVGFGAAAPDFGPQHITEAMPILLVLAALAYTRMPRLAPQIPHPSTRTRTAIMAATALVVTIGIVSIVAWSNRPYLRGTDRAVASQIPNFDGTLISAVNQGHVRSDLQQLHAITGGRVFISVLPASFYYLAANLRNPIPYDYPARSDLGTGGERGVITAIRQQHVRWVCIRSTPSRHPSPIEPVRVETYIRHRFTFAKHLNLCDLYHARRAKRTDPTVPADRPELTDPQDIATQVA
jgi:hypothetical protein